MGKLFGTSGIRGVVGEQITPELVLDLGLALATQLGGDGAVVVGKDPRTSSDMLESCLISGLLSGGCDVKRLGVVPTPVVSFGVRHLGAKAGAMITASHNPPEYNGVKFWDSSGMAYTPEQEEKIEAIYFGKKMKPAPWDGIGEVESVDVVQAYLEKIESAASLKRSYKVVVDCGNGAGSVVTPILLRRLGCKVVTLNSQLDGFFPGRGLEPSPENLGELCEVVKSIGADLGIAHDGDADRAAAVDDRGRVAQPDKLLGLISANQLKRKEVVVTTVDASSVVDDCVTKRGGKVVRTRVGDVSVATAIKKHRAVFGGEPSGAWIFPGVHLAPDGVLAAVKILEMIDSTSKKLSELLNALPEYPTVREKVPCPNERKAGAIKKLAPILKKKFSDVVEVLTIDGVRLKLKDGWVLVRPSGTEPYIRVTAEGKTPARAREIAGKATKVLKAVVGARS